jgi:hypothetical protein
MYLRLFEHVFYLPSYILVFDIGLRDLTIIEAKKNPPC